jgi:RES domain-containing protein
MIVYRLAKSKYINDLSGMGARLTGGRWNSKGLSLVYTSSSRALCMAEMAVHLPLGIMPHDYCLAQILIPDSTIIEPLDIKKWPKGWNQFPVIAATQKIGDKFIIDHKHAVLKVPSAVVQGDFNYLINPLHTGIKKIKIRGIESFTFDERFFKR